MVGKGLADDVDYTHPAKDGTMGDKGWFFGKLKEFDKGRPYLKPGTAVRDGARDKTAARAEDLRWIRTGNGWSMRAIDGVALPELVDAQGRTAGRVRVVDGEWRVEAGGGPGMYWLRIPGKSDIALPLLQAHPR
jgi:hypothetical protein